MIDLEQHQLELKQLRQAVDRSPIQAQADLRNLLINWDLTYRAMCSELVRCRNNKKISGHYNKLTQQYNQAKETLEHYIVLAQFSF
jgi:hypothetical protein